MLRLPVIEYFIESLKIKDLDNCLLALSGLKVLLEYGKEIKISYDYKENIVKKQIEHLNGHEMIEKCGKSLNMEISSLSNTIFNQFFSKDESNKLNN